MLNVKRKITYRLYPSRTQAETLEHLLGLHCRVYNTLLEEHQRQYEQDLPRYSFRLMCQEITKWRAASSLSAVNAQSLQVTAKRVDLAFKAFFRRVKQGETPGYPRFKAAQRYPGWGYKTHGDGWKLHEGDKSNHRLYLSGVGTLKIRGRGRFDGVPKTCEVINKSGRWYASVTFDVELKTLHRPCGSGLAAFDWGLKELLTLAKSDGTMETISNPRFLKRSAVAMVQLQRAISCEELNAKALIGLLPADPIPKGMRLPVTRKLKRMYRQVAALHRKIANQRHDFYHKLANLLVARFGALATEELDVQSMTKKPRPKPDQDGSFLPNGAGRKAKLNRGILDAAPAKLIQLLTCKAEEAGVWLGFANTKIVKPTQRCHRCGTLVAKTLEDREHICPCGCRTDRDENAAKTLLRWANEEYFWSGTVPAGS